MLSDLSATNNFQHDGASVCSIRAVQNLLDEEISDSWNCWGDPMNCPAQFPDLTLLDTLLWGFVNYNFFKTTCLSLDQFKRPIKSSNWNIQTNLLQNVWKSIQNRFSAVVQDRGQDIESTMWYEKLKSFKAASKKPLLQLHIIHFLKIFKNLLDTYETAFIVFLRIYLRWQFMFILLAKSSLIMQLSIESAFQLQ